jgi:hypothetical protein
MPTGPKPDYDELPHDHKVILARCDYAVCYVLASSASDDQLNNRTTKGKYEVCSTPLNTENGQCQEPKDNPPSNTQNVIGKMDKLTQLNTKTLQEGKQGQSEDLQRQKTKKKISGTARNATISVSLAARKLFSHAKRKLFKLPHEAEVKITTFIDDNFIRLENVINENICLQCFNILELLEKKGLKPDELAMVFNTIAKVNSSLVGENEREFKAARQATAEACNAVMTEVMDASCEV